MPRDLIDDDFEIEDELIEPDREIPHSIPEPPARQQLAGGERLEQRRFMGGDTLDEPVWATIMRDVYGFGRLLKQTLGLKPSNESREWDLWGPLIFCLSISLLLSLNSKGQKTSYLFSAVFTVLWLGQALITANVRLLGGSISFMRALCITGYSLFPLVLGATFSWIVHLRWVRFLVTAVLVVWAVWSASRGLSYSGVLPRRMLLASYPVALFYSVVGWLCVVA